MKEKYINLVSINVAWDSYTRRVEDFLTESNPDVVLLQEVFEDTFWNLSNKLQAEGVFAPLMRQGRRRWGLAILSHYPIVKSKTLLYTGNDNTIPKFDPKPDMDSSTRRGLLVAELAKDEERFRFITTKFTWTPDGNTTLQQRMDFYRMLMLLNKIDRFVLAGDFNIPRGGPLFDELAQRYKDNIPTDVTSTLDPVLHRSNGIEIVVDGLFTTPHYLAEKVQVVPGVSDHYAISARISTKNPPCGGLFENL